MMAFSLDIDYLPIFPNQETLLLGLPLPERALPIFTNLLSISKWKALQMNALISGRWDMDASIIGEDVGFVLPAATRSSIVDIVTMRPRACSATPLIGTNSYDRVLSK